MIDAGLRTHLQWRVADAGYSSLCAYAARLRTFSMFRLAWRLGPGMVTVADLAAAMVDEARTPMQRRECAYLLLVGAFNDIPTRYLADDAEWRAVLARVLVAWWHAVAGGGGSDFPDRIVRRLLDAMATPIWLRPRRSYSRLLRRVFDECWPRAVDFAFDPSLTTAEQL